MIEPRKGVESGHPQDRIAEPSMDARNGHARIDLQRANRDQLIAAGVLPDRIHIAPLCTMDRIDLFFSYRREKSVHGRVGRLMSIIGKKANTKS